MLMSRPVLLLGAASYSIYLVHDVVLGIALKLTGSARHSLAYDFLTLVVLLTVVLLVSLLLYTYYEAPARRWLRARWGKRPSQALSATQPAIPEPQVSPSVHGG